MTGTTYERRWRTLAVLSLSLIVIGLDNTVLNVALPSLQEDLGLSGSALQWVVDAYMLVFAGLLLAAGTLGDRYGRKRALQAGLAIFGLASVGGAFAETGGQLIAARAVMGAGAALIMPTTLSIIMDVFPQEERGKAIGVWAGMAAVGIGLGPLIGGTLIEVSSWPAVFWVNVPVILAALGLGAVLVPESRDPAPGRLDVQGVVLSVAALGTFVWSVIEAPERGWTDGLVLAGLAAAVVLGALFVRRQRRAANPLLDLGLFRRPAFSIGSLAISTGFFALFGMLFLVAQYLQFVQGKSALDTGVQMLPIAVGLVLGSGLSHRINLRVGAATQMAAALVVLAAAFATVLLWTPDTAYWALGLFFFIVPFAMGNVMAPASEAVMSAVPLAKAGVGSAMNDVNRMVAGALGVAIVGSVASSVYGSRMEDATAGLPEPVAETAGESVGAATAVAAELPGSSGEALAAAAGQAFTDALGLSLLVAVGAALAAAVAVRRGLADQASASTPSRSPSSRWKKSHSSTTLPSGSST
jgi:EmrB/QacA subfamily drug resistance transporter